MPDIDELERRIVEQSERQAEARTVQRQVEQLEASLDAARTTVADLEQTLAAEQQDVDQLEGLSFSRLWAAARGSRDEDLARERAEATRARAKLEHHQQAVREQQERLESLQQRRGRLTDADQLLAAALQAKEELLTDQRSALGDRLLDLAAHRGWLRNHLTEIDEARAVAATAQQQIAQADAELSSADGWSTYDTFFGGGVFSSSAKHQRMDAAATAIGRADRQLEQLSAEMADVTGAQTSLPSLQLDGFTRFTDVWFDNIFTDLDVRDRISDAAAGVRRMKHAVDEIEADLTKREDEARRLLDDISAERRTLLGAG